MYSLKIPATPLLKNISTILAFKIFNVLHGKVAKHVRCGGQNFNGHFTVNYTYLLQSASVKEF